MKQVINKANPWDSSYHKDLLSFFSLTVSKPYNIVKLILFFIR